MRESLSIGNSSGAWHAVLLILLFLFSISSLHAGEFKVSPILQTVAPGKTMATYRLKNTGQNSLTVQVSAHGWEQQAGERRLHGTDRLLIVPPLTTIGPGQEQLVRIALQGEPRSRELPFRVRFDEIPRQSPDAKLVVSTALRIDVPLFFTVAGARPDLDWGLSRTPDGGLSLKARNRGSGHARFSAVTLKSASGEDLVAKRKPLYLLPGKSRTWTFPDIAGGAGSKFVLEVESGVNQSSHVLVVE